MGKYPIHQTASGPDYMKPVVVGGKPVMTNNPIPEGTTFEVTHDGTLVRFQVDMNFYTDPNLVVMKVME